MQHSTRGHAEVLFEGRKYIAYSDAYDDALELRKDCVRHIEEFKKGKRTPPNGFGICDPYYAAVVDLEKRKFVVSGRIPEDTAPFLKTFIAARRNRCDILFESGAKVDALGIALEERVPAAGDAPRPERAEESAAKTPSPRKPTRTHEAEAIQKVLLNILRSAKSSKLAFLRLAALCIIPFVWYRYGSMRGLLPILLGSLMLTMIGSFSGDAEGEIAGESAGKHSAQ